MSNIELLNKLLELTIWMPIKGYENYEVSISGSVRNVISKKILKPMIRNGYYHINLRKNGKMKHHNIHRIVANTFIPNIENKKCVDHIDSNRLNNTISNLRWASYQENQFNTSLNSNNTSGIKGVWFNKIRNKWYAQIYLNYKRIHIGYYDNIEDAKIARKLKAKELFGEFLNEIEK
jgi:hypothetical protein